MLVKVFHVTNYCKVVIVSVSIVIVIVSGATVKGFRKPGLQIREEFLEL